MIISCKTTKIAYGENNEGLQKIKEVNTRAIFLMGLFENNRIKVIQNDSTLFDGNVISKIGQIQKIHVNKKFDVKLYIDTNEKPLVIIKAENLKNYLFCRVFYYKKRFYTEFTDQQGRPDAYNPFFKYHTEGEFNCKIIAIDSCKNDGEKTYHIFFKKKGDSEQETINMISYSKIDTLITDLPKITIGNSYKLFLTDFYPVSERITANARGEEYDELNNWIGEDCEIRKQYKEIKYWDANGLINLYYKRPKTK